MSNKIISYLQIKLSVLDDHTVEVVQKTSASFLVKVVGMVAAIFVSIYLGRALGPDGLGIISLAQRIISLIMVIVMLGMSQVLIKQTSIGFNRNDWQLVADSIFTSSLLNGFLALSITIVGIFSAPYLANNIFDIPGLEVPLTLFFITLLPQTFTQILAAGINGFRKIWQSILLKFSITPWVVGLLLLVFHFSAVEIDVIKVAVIYAIGHLVVLIAVIGYWKNLFHFEESSGWMGRQMLSMGIPMLIVSSTNVISSNADIIMLGWLSSIREVGLYTVAARIALLVGLLFQLSNSAISPKLASLFAENRKKEMQMMVTRVTTGLTVFAVLILAVFISIGSLLLNLWGNEFTAAYWILVVLGIGQVINVAAGFSGILLTMCGEEKVLSYITVISVVTNIILNYLFILAFGALGAAIATSTTIAGENILKAIFARKNLGILTLPIYKLYSTH